jgi:uncharacterized protein involved in outer membrane biogenesis
MTESAYPVKRGGGCYMMAGISAFLTVILLLVAVAGAGLAFIDLNNIKPDIVRAVFDATGRTITLNGPLRVS